MISLTSADRFTIPKHGLIHAFNPVDGLDVMALVGTIALVDGRPAKVLLASENTLSTVRPRHFTLKLDFTATPHPETSGASIETTPTEPDA